MSKVRRFFKNEDPDYKIEEESFLIAEYALCLKSVLHRYCKWVKLPVIERAIYYFLINKLSRGEAARKLFVGKKTGFLE
jgi:hypothetical protein